MSLKPELIGPVPEETVSVACAAFPKGNIYMRIRDELGVVFAMTSLPSSIPAVASRPRLRGGWCL